MAAEPDPLDSAGPGPDIPNLEGDDVPRPLGMEHPPNVGNRADGLALDFSDHVGTLAGSCQPVGHRTVVVPAGEDHTPHIGREFEILGQSLIDRPEGISK